MTTMWQQPEAIYYEEADRATRAAYLTGSLSTKSDFARTHANPVALAASLGLITVVMPGGSYGNTWRITSKGLQRLEQLG